MGDQIKRLYSGSTANTALLPAGGTTKETVYTAPAGIYTMIRSVLFTVYFTGPGGSTGVTPPWTVSVAGFVFVSISGTWQGGGGQTMDIKNTDFIILNPGDSLVVTHVVAQNGMASNGYTGCSDKVGIAIFGVESS